MSSELLSKTEWHSCLGCQAECKERQKATSGAQGWGVLGCRTCCSTSPCSQAFLIAFTSDFLPRMYYEYVHNSSLHGYVNFTLATPLAGGSPPPAPSGSSPHLLGLGFALLCGQCHRKCFSTAAFSRVQVVQPLSEGPRGPGSSLG